MKHPPLTDPYYGKIFEQYGLEACVAAGWFDDTYSMPQSYYYSPQPFNYAVPEKDEAPYIILINTGAYSPLHAGHIEMMELAKKKAEYEGYTVLAGVLIPAHDSYVSVKKDGTAASPLDVRVAQMKSIVPDWIQVCAWFAKHHVNEINFTDILGTVYYNQYRRNGKIVEVGYVFGSDNIGFAEVFNPETQGGPGIGICVNRPGYPMNIKSNYNMLWQDKPSINISSTEIRNER